MRNRIHGYTLVELLVVISIIGILISLALPAIQSAREAMNRTECVNNLRSIAQAAASHATTRGQLPGYCQKYGQFEGGFDRSDPGNFGGDVPAHVKIGSWHVALLTHLDNTPIYEVWTDDTYPLLSDGGGERPKTFEGYSSNCSPNLKFFQCPSSSGSIARNGRNSYIANTGMHVDAFPFTYTRPFDTPQTVTFARSINRNNAVFTNRYAGYVPGNPAKRIAVGRAMTLDDFKDGLSNTMLISESQQAKPWYLTSLSGNTAHLTNFQTVGQQMVSVYPVHSRYVQGAVWHFEDPANFAAAPSPAKLHKINGGDVYNLQMNSGNFADVARPSSLHTDGVNMAFADGSVRFVSNWIDYRTYQALLTPHGKASDVPMNEYLPTGED